MLGSQPAEDPMMRALAPSLLVLGIVSAVAAQGPIVQPPKTPQARQPLRDQEFPVIVKGCVRGNRLKIDRALQSVAVDYLEASEFVLEGPKEFLRPLLKAHDGHEEEVTGTAIVPVPDVNDRHVETKRVGSKTVVTAGSGSTLEKTDHFNPIRLKVEGMAHIENKCGF
jgi:hypothetical protein